MVNEYMQSARVCCWQCGKSFVSEMALQTHEARQHPAAIVRSSMQATYRSEMGSGPSRANPEMGSGPSREISEMGSGPSREISDLLSVGDTDVCSICSS